MMVDVLFRKIDMRAQRFESALKTFRHGNATERANECVAQALERQSFAGINVLKIEWLMGALDDLSSTIVTADALNEEIIRFARIFGDEDVARTPQIPR